MRMYHLLGPTGKHQAAIVDVDGTLVNVSSLHSYLATIVNPDGTYKQAGLDTYHRLAQECPAIWETIDKCEGMHTQGVDVVVVTARSERYRGLTKQWLHKYAVPYRALYMRPEGDHRPDYDVKKDLLAEIQEQWDVVRAYDDNPKVLALWEEMGIPADQVPGWVELDTLS